MVLDTDLAWSLQDIGLEEYTRILQAEGFDTWQQLLDISEDDMIALDIKLGHRRRLQRAIQEYRQHEEGSAPPELSSRSQEQSQRYPPNVNTSSSAQQEGVQEPHRSTAPQKRKYRRHPKPDENAPERPPSAYVIFSNRVRERLRGQDLSFTEIAKIVGEQWQDPDPEERAACERQAQALKETYYSQLSEYKRTPEWLSYQAYLADFRAKHADKSAKDIKRPKTETNSNMPTPRSNSDEIHQDGLSPSIDGGSLTSYTTSSASSLVETSHAHGMGHYGHASSASSQSNSQWSGRRLSLYGGSTHSSSSYSTVMDNAVPDGGLPLRQQNAAWTLAVDGQSDGQPQPIPRANDRIETLAGHAPLEQSRDGYYNAQGPQYQREAGVIAFAHSSQTAPVDFRDRRLPPPPGLMRNKPVPDPLQSIVTSKSPSPLTPNRPDMSFRRPSLSLRPIFGHAKGETDGDYSAQDRRKE